MKDLKCISTKDLIEELKSREGVNTKIAEPYETVQLSIDGPAIVFAIID